MASAKLPKAVVIGLGSVTGLQTARILAAAGVDVVGIAGDRRHFAARTRVCQRIWEADVHGPGFLEVLEKLGPELDQRAVLFPCTDQAVLVVSAHRLRLEAWFQVALPDHAVVRTLARKDTFHAHALSIGLQVPQTYPLADRVDAIRAARRLPYPVLLKPATKTPAWKRRAGVKVCVVRDPAGLLDAYDRLRDTVDTLVAQEYVSGGDDQLYTCNCYIDAEQRPLATFVTRKRRQWPPGVGTASFGEEVRDDEVLRQTLRLFGSVPYRGFGYLELKYDATRRRHVVIEANIGRPTGRSATAEAGEVELVRTAYCEAAGLPLPAARRQRYTGAAWVDLRRDLLASVHAWRKGELRPAEWLRSMRRRPKAHAVASMRDPVPFLLEVTQSSRRAAARLARRAIVTARLRPR